MTDQHLDLDARRAARREAEGQEVTFTFGGETFTLPVEMPLAALDLITGVDVEALSTKDAINLFLPLVKAMLGEAEWARLLVHRPTVEDLVDLTDFMWSAYGVDPPQPSQPPRSARRTGQRSKQTSKRSTASTRATSGVAV